MAFSLAFTMLVFKDVSKLRYVNRRLHYCRFELVKLCGLFVALLHFMWGGIQAKDDKVFHTFEMCDETFKIAVIFLFRYLSFIKYLALS